MVTFLPTDNDEYKLWFDDVIKMLPWFSLSFRWNAGWIVLLARLAKDQLWKIDWVPYIDTFISILLKSLDLPIGRMSVGIKNLSKYTNSCFDDVFANYDDVHYKKYTRTHTQTIYTK